MCWSRLSNTDITLRHESQSNLPKTKWTCCLHPALYLPRSQIRRCRLVAAPGWSNAVAIATGKAITKTKNDAPRRWRVWLNLFQKAGRTWPAEATWVSSIIDHLAAVAKNGFQLRRKTPSHDQIALANSYFLLLELWLRELLLFRHRAWGICSSVEDVANGQFFRASSSGSGSCLSCFGTFIIIIIIKYQSCLSLAIFVIYELKLCLLGVSRIWAWYTIFSAAMAPGDCTDISFNTSILQIRYRIRNFMKLVH